MFVPTLAVFSTIKVLNMISSPFQLIKNHGTFLINWVLAQAYYTANLTPIQIVLKWSKTLGQHSPRIFLSCFLPVFPQKVISFVEKVITYNFVQLQPIKVNYKSSFYPWHNTYLLINNTVIECNCPPQTHSMYPEAIILILKIQEEVQLLYKLSFSTKFFDRLALLQNSGKRAHSFFQKLTVSVDEIHLEFL